LSTGLEENSIFHVAENIFVDVDIKEENDLLKINRHIEVNDVTPSSSRGC
jgi:hypothetical protein